MDFEKDWWSLQYLYLKAKCVQMVLHQFNTLLYMLLVELSRLRNFDCRQSATNRRHDSRLLDVPFIIVTQLQNIGLFISIIFKKQSFNRNRYSKL